MNKKCNKCGNLCELDDKFCRECGNRLGDVTISDIIDFLSKPPYTHTETQIIDALFKIDSYIKDLEKRVGV